MSIANGLWMHVSVCVWGGGGGRVRGGTCLGLDLLKKVL